MQLMSLLLSALFLGINSTNCPIGYADGGDGSCYSSIFARNSRNIAYNKCSVDGGYLYDISSDVENTKTAQRAGTAEAIWLGLTCLLNEKTSCLWDATGRAIVLGSFTNFVGGAPNITRGPCVYMDVKTGGWLSGDCTFNTNYYGCKFTPNITVPTCSTLDNTIIDGISFAVVFREKCYWGMNGVNSSTDGQLFCANDRGTIASIHSLGENAFINTFAWSFSPLAFAYTGLASNAKGDYSWADGSPFDYSNFAYQNAQLGSCVAMSLYGETIPQGKWINSGCSQAFAIVCERVWYQPSWLATTTRDPYRNTKAPSKCSSTQFLTGNGTLYSPGYPYNSDSNDCSYMITVAQNQTAQIVFSTLHLFDQSILSFYSDSFTDLAFAILNNASVSRTVISSTNTLKIKYHTAGDGSNWAGKYEVAPSDNKCSSTRPYYDGSGVIKSPDYPDGSSIASSCEYVIIESADELAQIQITSNLSSGSSLIFYSDEFSDSSLINILTYVNKDTNIISTTNVLRMYFNTAGGYSKWTGYYQSIPACKTTFFGYGTISSPNYPNSYRNNSISTCIYSLNSEYITTCVKFDDINIEYGDYIRIYDGQVGNDLIGQFGGADSSSQVFCSSGSSILNVVFRLNQYNDYSLRGFQGRFASNSSFLQIQNGAKALSLSFFLVAFFFVYTFF